MKRDMKCQKFITIQEIEICETACQDQHICCTKVFANEVASFHPMGTKVHINYALQHSK
jgi:hypothetical protein